MIRFLVDEGFDLGIVEALGRRVACDFLRVQAAGLGAASDDDVLQFAAKEGRPTLSHDWRTMPTVAYQRMAEGLEMPGLLVVPWEMPIGRAAEALHRLTVEYKGEFANLVLRVRK